MKTNQTGSSMVSGFLGTLTTEERTLLHLLDNQLPENNWEAPMELTQAGISAAVHAVSYTHLTLPTTMWV